MGSHVFCRTYRFWLKRNPHSQFFNLTRNSYIVLLPEVPTDNAQTNTLLRTKHYVDFENLTFKKCYNGVGKIVLEFEGEMCKLEETLKDPEYNRSFQSIIDIIENKSVPVDYAWSVVKLLYIVKNTFIKKDKYHLLHERAAKARVQKYTSLPVFFALKEVSSSGDVLTDVQKRVIEKYLLEGKLNGIELTGHSRKALDGHIRNIDQTKKNFQKNLEEGTKRFRHTITDAALIREIPSSVLGLMSENRNQPDKAPWTVTLQPDIYAAFLEYCPDRIHRWNIWRAAQMRASADQDADIDNSVHIEDLRNSRRLQAECLGYDSYMAMSMETKMAGNVKNVQSMIDTLLAEARPTMEKELESLQEFASARGFRSKIEEWDVPYWRRKQRQTFFNVDDSLVREYFPYEVVRDKLFILCEQLLDFKIIRNKKVSVWHKDVEFYSVLDKTGAEISAFYIDPYLRPSEKLFISSSDCWLVSLRNRSVIAGTSPLSALVFNFTPPLASMPCLLSFNDVIEFFEKFGLCLQHSLTNSPYSEVAGATNLEWDIVNVVPNFMKFWLCQPQTLEDISCHYQHQQSMPADLITSICFTQQHMAGYDMCRELYYSHLDKELHSRVDLSRNIVKELWPKYSTFGLEKKNNHVCSFSSIFSGDWAAAYYSNIWAKVVAADLFNAFLETGVDNNDMKKVGNRLRKTYFSLGGSANPNEVFRKFRGRDPCSKALLKLLGMNQD